MSVAVFDAAFAWNLILIVYASPLINLHGVVVQSVTSNDWIVPNADPQSSYCVAVHTKFNEEDNNTKPSNENIFALENDMLVIVDARMLIYMYSQMIIRPTFLFFICCKQAILFIVSFVVFTLYLWKEENSVEKYLNTDDVIRNTALHR
jgi:hypothetical protein